MNNSKKEIGNAKEQAKKLNNDLTNDVISDVQNDSQINFLSLVQLSENTINQYSKEVLTLISNGGTDKKLKEAQNKLHSVITEELNKYSKENHNKVTSILKKKFQQNLSLLMKFTSITHESTLHASPFSILSEIEYRKAEIQKKKERLLSKVNDITNEDKIK